MCDIIPVDKLNEHQANIREMIKEFHETGKLGIEDMITEIAVQRAGRELEQATIKSLKESFLEMRDPYIKKEPFLKMALEYAVFRSSAKAKLSRGDTDSLWVFFMMYVNMHNIKTPGDKRAES